MNLILTKLDNEKIAKLVKKVKLTTSHIIKPIRGVSCFSTEGISGANEYVTLGYILKCPRSDSGAYEYITIFKDFVVAKYDTVSMAKHMVLKYNEALLSYSNVQNKIIKQSEGDAVKNAKV